MATRYRAYVGEPATVEDVTTLTAEYFAGATITEAVGLWEGETERSVVVEVIDCYGELTPLSFRHFAEAARSTFEQQSVLVTIDEIIAELV